MLPRPLMMQIGEAKFPKVEDRSNYIHRYIDNANDIIYIIRYIISALRTSFFFIWNG